MAKNNPTNDEEYELSMQLKSAYRKYKTYIYYDNHSSIQRAELAKFEFDVFECGNIERCIFSEDSICESCESCEFDLRTQKFNKDFDIGNHFDKILTDEKDNKKYKENIDDFFSCFARELLENPDKIFKKLLSRVDILAFPKKFKINNKNKYDNPPIVIKNIREEKYHVEQSHYFISLPVEAHILGVLWILRSGWVLDHKLYKNSYGNRINNNVLEKIEKECRKGKQYSEFNPFLFDAYFKKYQSWRDDGLDEVNNILDNDKNAIMISLDFKDYYYSSTINFDDLKCDINNTKKIIFKNYNKCKEFDNETNLDDKLTDFIEKVFLEYTDRFDRTNYNDKIILNRCKEEILELYKKYYKSKSSKEITITLLEKIYNNDSNFEKDGKILENKKKELIDILKEEFKHEKNYIDLKKCSKLEKEVLGKIHEYSNCFNCEDGAGKERYKILPLIPLGFLPSLIISNWNLHGFDQAILEKLTPNYYGRYVDDLLIVISDAKKSESDCTKNLGRIGLNEIVHQYLTPKDPEPHNSIFKIDSKFESKKTDACENYNGSEKCKNHAKDIVYNAQSQHIDCPHEKNYNNKTIHFYYDNLQIQKNKMKLFVFSHENSRAMINKFRNEIYHTISEFRLMHDVDKVFEDLEGDIYSINYEGSINKLKDIKYAEINKFELSKNISRLTYDFSCVDDYKKDKMIDEVIKSFEGNLLNFMILWEKLFTLLLVVDEKKKFEKQLRKILNLIKNIEVDDFQDSKDSCKIYKVVKPKNGNWDEKDILITSLSKFLYFSCKRTLSLKTFDLNIDKIFNEEICNYEKPFWFKNGGNFLKNNQGSFQEIKIKTNNLFSYFFISSSLQNNLLMKDPLQNLDNIKNNLIKNETYDLINSKNITGEFKGFCYPRYVQFHECTLNTLNKNLLEQNEKFTKNLYNHKYLETSYKNYYTLNFLHFGSSENIPDERFYKKECNDCYKYEGIKCPENYSKKDNCGVYEDYCIDVIKSGDEKKDNIKVGLVNTRLEFDNFSNALKGKPNRTSKRLSDIIKIINEATEKDKKVDLLLMPENFIPYDWIDMVVEMSRKHQIAMIFGVEHVINNGYVGNYIAMTLPSKDKDNGYLNCVITLRLKNAYAPIELQEFAKKGLKPLKNEKIHHILCIWNDVYIAPYYCYEIADIAERSIFKSCCDIVAISEYNKDVNYFNNIAESLVRDLFCYCIKSNTSEYGGTCVLQPTSSENKYFVQLKGGESSYIVTQTLKILKLREEQINTYASHNIDAYFKHHPPNFNSDVVKCRMGLPIYRKIKKEDKKELPLYEKKKEE